MITGESTFVALGLSFKTCQQCSENESEEEEEISVS